MKQKVLLFFIQQKVPRGCPRKNVFFRIRNISRRKQASGKKHAEHCLRHLNKTACEIWSVFDKVLFCVKYLTPFFHRTLQLIYICSLCQFLHVWMTFLSWFVFSDFSMVAKLTKEPTSKAIERGCGTKAATTSISQHHKAENADEMQHYS